MAPAKIDGGLQIAQLGAAIKAHSGVAVGQDLLFTQHRRNAISELNLAARSRSNIFKVMENAWRQDVTTDDGQC